MNHHPKIKYWLILLVLCVGLAGIGIVSRHHASDIKAYLLDPDTNPLSFILMYLFLPILGFPILPFLIILGAKFGAAKGLLLMAAGISLHLLASYAVSNTFLHPFLERFSIRNGINIPRFENRRNLLTFSFLFMVIPGLSYAMKNYLLPLTKIPFVYYFLIGMITQGGLGIPFVVAGNAMESRQLIIPLLLMAVLGGGYLMLGWQKRKKELKDKS